MVYIEEWLYTDKNDGQTGKKTSRAELYDAKSGKKIRSFNDPRIASMRFSAISPSGKVIYHDKRDYFLLNLGHVFPDQKVVTQPQTQADAVFYTNR